MSRGDTEIPVSEDYATTEEPTMPILVEEGLASSMLREQLHIHDNDAYSSSEEPTMPKLTIEGTITGPSKKVPPPVSAMASLTPGCNGVSTDLAAHPVQNSIEKIVTEITTPKAETNPLGRNRRTKTTQNSSDLGTQVVQLRRVGKHSCNLCQSPDSTTPKRPRSDCNVSEVKRTRRKENPGPTEELFAPLKLGWIREIVTRHISSHAKQDVYYHPPYGKKLRSLVEIGKYLKQENMTALLTVDNFTFFAEPLGYGEPFEIVRGALMRSQSVSKTNGSPKKEQILTPKKGYHIKKSKLTPKSTNNPKTKAKSAKQKSVEKMAKHAHVAESSDEEYQVITEIAESDEVVALHLAETDNLEIGHQAEAVVKNTKVQIKKKITHSSEQGNIFSSPERKEVYQETKNPKYIASTQSLMIAPGSVSERYITRTGSPKRIRITAENKNGNSSMNKKMAEHCQNVQKPVEFPQEDQLSPKESYSIKVNETHEGEHSNQHETEKISLNRHNNYISLNPVVINDIDEHYEVSETVHKKSKRKRIEKNMNGIKLTGKEKLGLQKKQIKKEKPLPSEVLFVASGILENFEEDHVKATELSGNTMSTILPTLHIKEEPVENEFLPVISSVKSGKEAEEMLETSEEPLRLWFNQTSNPQKARRGKAIGAQPRNTKNYPEINGQKTHKTTVVSRRQLKTNLGSTNIVKEQKFVPQNDKTTSTVPFLISSKKKKKKLSPPKNTNNLNRNSVTQTTVKKQIQPLVSFPVPLSEMCNTIMNVKPQNSHSVLGNLNLQSWVPSSMQNPATTTDSLQNPVTITDSRQTVVTCEILRPSSVKNGITAATSNESDSQSFDKQEGKELLRELLTKKKTEENHLNHEIPSKSKFAHLITINRKRIPVQQSAMLPLNLNQPSAADTQVHQMHLNSFAPHLPETSVASQIYPSLASSTPQIVINAKQPTGPQSASFLLKPSQSGAACIQPFNTPLRSVAPCVPGTLVASLPSFSPLAISTKQPPISQSANLPLNPNKSHAADKHARYTPLYLFNPNKPASSVASQVCHSPSPFTRNEQTQTETPPVVNHKAAKRKESVNYGNST